MQHQARFWAKVDSKGGPDACWPFQGCRDKWGYAHTAIKHKRVQAHRKAYELSVGEIPAGMCLLHSCDNPPCCNPKHLRLGTNAENVADKMRKGRHPVGVEAYNAKLNEEKVREMRRLRQEGMTYKKLGALFQINYTTARYVCRGDNWGHVK
jgi:hypothetical protein